MEPYALLIIFGAMVAIWWVSWAPWKARDEAPQDSEDEPQRGPRGR